KLPMHARLNERPPLVFHVRAKLIRVQREACITTPFEKAHHLLYAGVRLLDKGDKAAIDM
nr:hypothetical protein [Candidatus Sigynarchaeota archaeon]